MLPPGLNIAAMVYINHENGLALAKNKKGLHQVQAFPFNIRP
jgi:hypothetical protein